MNRMRSALVALAVLGTAGLAQARDNVYWSVGVDAAPGVTLGVGNARPVVVAPPVYMAPQPVYVAPQPVYVQPPVVYRAAPVYYGAAPVYYGPPGHWRHHHRKWKHHHH